MKCGSAQRDITPSYPVWLHGYWDRTKKSNGIAEKINLACLAIANDNEKFIILSVDAVAVHLADCQRMRENINSAFDIKKDNIMINASHTHFAPGLYAFNNGTKVTGFKDPDERFIKDFHTKIHEVTAEALANMEETTLEIQRINAPQLIFNRRTIKKNDGRVETNYVYPKEPEKYNFKDLDNEVVTLRFRRDDGTYAGLLVNYACHAVSGNEQHDYISSDYVYYLRMELEHTYRTNVVFTLGAAGDVVPVKRGGLARQQIGSLLAQSIIFNEPIFLKDSCETLKADNIYVKSETLRKLNCDEVVREYGNAPESDEYANIQVKYMRVMAYPDNEFDIPVQIITIGSIVLVAWPFEVGSELALLLKKKFSNAILVSLSGGANGYLFLEHEYGTGGYEVEDMCCNFVPDTAERLLTKTLDKLAQIQRINKTKTCY